MARHSGCGFLDLSTIIKNVQTADSCSGEDVSTKRPKKENMAFMYLWLCAVHNHDEGYDSH